MYSGAAGKFQEEIKSRQGDEANRSKQNNKETRGKLPGTRSSSSTVQPCDVNLEITHTKQNVSKQKTIKIS